MRNRQVGTGREGKAGRRGLSARLPCSLPHPESKRGSAASQQSAQSLGGFFSNWNHHPPKAGSQVSPQTTRKKRRSPGRAGGSGAREAAPRGRLGRSPESARLPRESASLPDLAQRVLIVYTEQTERGARGNRGRDRGERERRPAPAQPWIPVTGALGPCPKSRA